MKDQGGGLVGAVGADDRPPSSTEKTGRAHISAILVPVARVRLPFKIAAVVAAIGLTVAIGLIAGTTTMRMPGDVHEGPLPAPTPAQGALAAQLRTDVEHLAIKIGERHASQPGNLNAARDMIIARFADLGLEVTSSPFDFIGTTFANLEVLIPPSC